MLLARSAALLRMNELRIVALQIVVIVGNGLMIGRLLIIVGHKVDDVAVSIAAGSVLRCVIVDRRWRNHITI